MAEGFTSLAEIEIPASGRASRPIDMPDTHATPSGPAAISPDAVVGCRHVHVSAILVGSDDLTYSKTWRMILNLFA